MAEGVAVKYRQLFCVRSWPICPRRSLKQLLVGTETGDDAAVWKIDGQTCLISTTDFFMPMVDDPRDFGRIAATNAISDVYAMGGKPIFALAILGMPLNKIAPDQVREILEGFREVWRRQASRSRAAIPSTRRSQSTGSPSTVSARLPNSAETVTQGRATSLF